MGVWAVGIAGVAAIAISGTPGSLALWNDAEEVTALTVTTGRLDAAIAPGTTTPTTATAATLPAIEGLLPTESRGLTFTVRNTGTVPLTLAAALSGATPGATPHVDYGISPGACPATPPAGTPLTTTPVAIGTTLAPGADASFCLRVTLNDTVPGTAQGQFLGAYTIDLTAGSTP